MTTRNTQQHKFKKSTDPVFEKSVDKNHPAKIGHLAFDFHDGNVVEAYFNVFKHKNGGEIRKEQMFDLRNMKAIKNIKRVVENAEEVVIKITESGADIITVFPVHAAGRESILPFIDKVCKRAGYKVTDYHEELKSLGNEEMKLLHFKLVKILKPISTTVSKLSTQKMSPTKSTSPPKRI